MAGDIPLRKLRIAITGGGLAVNAQRALAEIIPSANELLHKAGAVPMNSIRLVIVCSPIVLSHQKWCTNERQPNPMLLSPPSSLFCSSSEPPRPRYPAYRGKVHIVSGPKSRRLDG